MTKLHSQTWASRIEPHIRDYITAVISEAFAPVSADIAEGWVREEQTNAKLAAEIGDLTARMNDLEVLMNLPSYKIAKLLELASKE